MRPEIKKPSMPKFFSFGSSAIFHSGDPPLSVPSSQRVRLSRDIPSSIIFYHENMLLSSYCISSVENSYGFTEFLD
jgi:hypothetical protein